jgi:hypothetical protein
MTGSPVTQQCSCIGYRALYGTITTNKDLGRMLRQLLQQHITCLYGLTKTAKLSVVITDFQAKIDKWYILHI